MATKHFIAALLLVPTLACAGDYRTADEISYEIGQAWSQSDTDRQAAYLLLHVIDWGQTRDIAAKCDHTTYYETNPILGSCPSTEKVDRYFLVTGIAHYAISRALPPKWRRTWQKVTIGIEIGAVANNVSVGLNVQF